MTEITVLLREMSNTLQGISLYHEGHPLVLAAMERVEQRIVGSLAARREVSVLFLDGKVVIDGTPVAEAEGGSRALARAMRALGRDRLTFLPGLAGGEARQFITALASPSIREGWSGTAHIRLDALQGGLRVRSNDLSMLRDENDPSFLHSESDALGEIWDGVASSKKLEMDTLEDIVSVLSKVISDNFGAMIPLAQLKSHDEYTFTHIINVGILSMGLARAVGLPSRTVRDVGIAALLHDVGKALVPLEVLNKPDRLNEEEFDVIRQHPLNGARLLLRTPGAPELAVAVAYEHHARHDGGGYPRLPEDWRKNFASAITQIADFYDALRTRRPYRPEMPSEKIVSIMTSESGRHFDPELLQIFFDRVVPRDRPVPAGEGGSAGTEGIAEPGAGSSAESAPAEPVAAEEAPGGSEPPRR